MKRKHNSMCTSKRCNFPLTLVCSPDKVRGDFEAANKRFALVNIVYTILKDDDEREWSVTRSSSQISRSHADQVRPGGINLMYAEATCAAEGK